MSPTAAPSDIKSICFPNIYANFAATKDSVAIPNCRKHGLILDSVGANFLKYITCYECEEDFIPFTFTVNGL